MADFLIDDNPPFHQYTASVGQTQVPYTFWVSGEDDIDFWIDGVEQLPGVDFTLSKLKDNAGGNLLLAQPLEGGEKLTLWRNTARLRSSGYSTGGSLRARTLNLDFATVIAMIQELTALYDRTVRFSPVSTQGQAPLLPDTLEDGRALVWDGDAERFKNSDANLETLLTDAKSHAEAAEESAAAAANSAGSAAVSASAAANSADSAAVSASAATASAGSAAAYASLAEEAEAQVETMVALGMAGFRFLQSCRVATTSSLTATYNNGINGVGATLTNSGTQAALEIDGVFLTGGDRVLVKDQASALQNGIYTVTNEGSGSSNWVLTRATDFDGTLQDGSFTNILEGFVHQQQLWLYTGNATPAWGADNIPFEQIAFTGFGGGTVLSVTAGTGLSGGEITDSGTIAFDPSGLTQVALASGDRLVIADASDSWAPKLATAPLGEPTGTLKIGFWTSVPSGWENDWVLAVGTIGNASSGATNRANADTEALFIHLWTQFPDALAPVSGGRGVSAAADFAANKTITIPDIRGCAFTVLDNLGGTAANRVTAASTNGANASVLGGIFGAETHTLTLAEGPEHDHDYLQWTWTATGGSGSNRYIRNTLTDNRKTGKAGGGQPHSNTGPRVAIGALLKL